MVLLTLQACSSKNIPEVNTADPSPREPGAPSVIESIGYVISSGDEIKITVWRNPDLDRVVRVGPTGMFFYPLVGEINAEGLGTEELRKIITHGLSPYFLSPQVNVDILTFMGRKVYVLGEVKKPGRIIMEGSLNIMDALLLAGGFTRDSNQEKVLLIKPTPETINLQAVNIKRLLSEGDITQFVSLKESDIVYVPPSTIANVDRFFERLGNIIEPIVDVEKAIVLGNEIKEIIEGGGERTIIVR